MAYIGIAMLLLGVFFDMMSFCYGIGSLIGKRYRSGFLWVALFYYAVGVTVLPKVPAVFSFPSLPFSDKMVFFLLLCGVHWLCQFPGRWAVLKYPRPKAVL
jgi:uncharacterized membrane protein YhaH (DUF805 family)